MVISTYDTEDRTKKEKEHSSTLVPLLTRTSIFISIFFLGLSSVVSTGPTDLVNDSYTIFSP